MFAHQVIEDLKKWKTIAQRYDDRWGKFKVADYNQTIKSLQKAQCFHFGNVNEWSESFKRVVGDNPFMDIAAQDIKPPYKVSWFDFIFPSVLGHIQYSSKQNQENGGATSLKSGLLIIDSSENDSDLSLTVKVFRSVQGSYPLPGQEQTETYEWELSGTYLIVPNEKNERNKEAGPMFFTIDGNLGPREFWSLSDIFHKRDDPILKALNMCLLLINCQNITTKTTPAPKKLNKKRIQKGKQPLFTYKTLVIKPTGKKQESIPKHLWENRIHLQRGHFKTYTDEKPLFGKYTGRYWWQPSVRGRNTDGVVIKDYLVKND